MPQARRIPLSRRSHIIGFQPLTKRAVFHESALERDFVTLTSFLNPAALIESQPVTIGFEDKGCQRRYTPDFLVRDAAAPELIEIKYERDLKDRWDQYAPAFEAAEHWARHHHMKFRVVTESVIRIGLLDNAKRLLPIRALPMNSKTAMLALTHAHRMDRPTFGRLVEALPDRNLALATVWRLIARGELHTDLSIPITFDSELCPK